MTDGNPTDPPETNASATAEKTCPDCGASLRAAAALCRHCGYVFPLGKGKPSTAGLTAELAAAPLTARKSHHELLRLAMPILGLVLVAVIALIFVVQNRPRETWQADLEKMPAVQTRFDRRFQSGLLVEYRSDQLEADVRAAGGICLINIDTDERPGGLVRRAGTKLAAAGLACAYADGRRINGEGSHAQVTIYVNGRRYSSAACDR